MSPDRAELRSTLREDPEFGKLRRKAGEQKAQVHVGSWPTAGPDVDREL